MLTFQCTRRHLVLIGNAISFPPLAMSETSEVQIAFSARLDEVACWNRYQELEQTVLSFS